MNNNLSLFEKYITSEASYISFFDLLVNSLIIIIISFVLKVTYVTCAKSFSDKRSFSNNFFLITYTTMIIIMVVKSSLALSLGLIGALSIIRFRTAIKEPEELAYLFLNIAIGLGLGASQQFFIIVGTIIIITAIWVKHILLKKENYQNIVLVIKIEKTELIEFDNIINIISENVYSADLKRFENDQLQIEAVFSVELKDISEIQICRKKLFEKYNSISISFIDNSK